MHEYHGFPGTYIYPCMNEYPNAQGGVPRTDSSYYIRYHGRKCVMNWEEESVKIDATTFKKVNRYRINLEYFLKRDVISAITTTAPLEKCNLDFDSSPTLPFKPIIISYPEFNGSERLSTIKSKINHEKILTKVEAMDLVMIPKMFTSHNDIVLEEVCKLLSRVKIDDSDFKLELILEMKCVIHKYAKTIADIERLEDVIGLQAAMTAKEYQDQKLIDQGYDNGYDNGSFETALKVKKLFGIEKALLICNFTREELENEKLNE